MKKVALLLFLCLASGALGQPMSTQGLNGVVVHIGFANDRGDVLDFVEYEGRKYDPSQAAALIPELGWEDRSKRGDIAWAWVTQVCLVGNTLLKQSPDDFIEAKIEFETPMVHSFEDGSIEIVLWYREPPGMLAGTEYSKRSYKFSPEGTLSVQELDRVSLPLK